MFLSCGGTTRGVKIFFFEAEYKLHFKLLREKELQATSERKEHPERLEKRLHTWKVQVTSEREAY